MKHLNISTIFALCGACCVFGAYIKPDIAAPGNGDKVLNELDNPTKDGQDNQAERTESHRAIKSPAITPLNTSTGTQPAVSKATANLVRTVLSNLRKRPPTSLPEKQLMGGKLPGMLERIVQRLQNYFSVYNPPQYFEGSRPPPTEHQGLAVVCSNVENDDLSCDPVPPEQYEAVQQECENAVAQVAEQPSGADGAAAAGEDGYNLVVTHTVVHDNLINVYSPPDTGSSQLVSNVVVILEPSAAEYSPAPQPGPIRNKDKFYVYVNPTAANKKKDQFQTKGDTQPPAEKPEPFQPYSNATYTVIIKGNKLHEFSNNIENADNGALNPDISPYVPSSRAVNQQSEKSSLASRSVPQNGQLPDIPNINLVLVPPDYQRNKSCEKDKIGNADLEYYILKPDNGNIIKPKDPPKKNSTQVGHKFDIDASSGTYLPPEELPPSQPTYQPVEATSVVNIQPSTSKFPLLFNLFTKKPEEPRIP